MGLLFILFGLTLVGSETVSLFGLMTPSFTPASLLLAPGVPPWGVHTIAIVIGLGTIVIGVFLVKALARNRDEEDDEKYGAIE